MGGVAEQRCAAVGPMADRLTVGGGPSLPVLRQVDQLARFRADALEVALDFVAAALAHAPLFLLAAVEGDDDVVLLAATQRIVHGVAVWADPDTRGIPLEVFRQILLLDHRAVDHVACHARFVADVLPAYRRFEPSAPITAILRCVPPFASCTVTPSSSWSTVARRSR
jgi:hypothetical protein